MSINFETVKNYLYSWASDNLPANTPVIFLYNNSPRPSTDYVTLNISSLVQIGDDYIPRPTTTGGEIEMVGDREFTLQIGTYGGDCLTKLEDLRSSLQKTTVLDTLRANGLIFVQQFPIQDVTELVATRFEKRAQMDVLFRLAQTYDDTLGSIETVVVNEEFSNSESIVYEETVTISIA